MKYATPLPHTRAAHLASDDQGVADRRTVLPPGPLLPPLWDHTLLVEWGKEEVISPRVSLEPL